MMIQRVVALLQDALQVVIRGTEDAVLTAIAAVKAALAEDKRANEETGDSERSRRQGDSKSDPALKPADAVPARAAPAIPIGASEEDAEEAMQSRADAGMSKSARRRAARKKAGTHAREDGPEWVDGLPGVSSRPDAILAQLLAPSSTAAETPARSAPRPPPGFTVPVTQSPPAAEGATAILAQLRSMTATAAVPAPVEATPAVSGRYYTSTSGFSVRL